MATGAFIFGCAGPRLLLQEAAFFRASRPAGFILFARNVEDPDQLRTLTADLRAAVGDDAPVFIDQEGGRVDRLAAPHWREWPAPLDHVAAMGEQAARGMYLRYRIIAGDLKALGIDANCAPLGDIADARTHPVLRNRCYGNDAVGVTRYARAVADGLLAGGVIPVVKHIPGHGRARVDSHLDLPRVAASAASLRAQDFTPFKALADLPVGMTAHLVYEAFDDQPATQSKVMVALIRDEIGFDGLLLTDDISMQALSGTVAARGQAALAAGCDVVLHCNGDMAEMETIAALGALTPRANSRLQAALNTRNPPDPVDIDALRAELDAISK